MEKKFFVVIMLEALLVGMVFVTWNMRMAISWSNGGFSADPANPVYGTHDWIAQHALDWLPAKEKTYIISNLAAYLYGTELPDNGGAPDGIGDTALHHVYFWANGSVQDDAAAIRAQSEYSKALNHIFSSNLALAAKTLGIMSHYIVDVAVFGHVMGSGTEWGAEVHHSDYEDYVNTRTNNYTDEFDAYLSFDGSLNLISAYDATILLANDTTFDLDGDLTCVWMDQNYDWNNPTFKNRCGESLNFAVNLLADVLHTFYVQSLYEWTDWTHYHNYTGVITVLQYLNQSFPTLVDVFSIGKSWENRDIYCVRLTNENITRQKVKLFFVGYHHAREPISAELPLYFAVEATTNFTTNTTLTRMLNYSEIYIVPALNVDAYAAVEANEWQRKNIHGFDEDNDTLVDEDPPDDEDGDGYIENLFYWDGYDYEFIRWEGFDDDNDGLFNEDWIGGVDLNRNYGYQWNATCDTGSPYPQDEDFRGPSPFSEPETQAIRNLALAHDFKYAVSFHSGASVILYPWAYTTAPTPHDALFRQIAANLSSLVGAPYGQSSSDLYTSSGTWDDWMYGNRNVLAFTCEIYTNESAWQYEPGPLLNTWWEKGVTQYFSPSPDKIETTVRKWLPVFTYLANRAIDEAYDVAVANVSSMKTIVGQGYSANVTVTIENQGDLTESFNVTLFAGSNVVQVKTVTLAGKSSTVVTFTWNTSAFSKGNYQLKAVADTVFAEKDTGDNSFDDGTVHVGAVGDVDGNKIVNMLDLYKIAVKYGAVIGQPLYVPNYDIDDNGIINMLDIYIAATHFGEIEP
ncbi:MAG: M14 family zinc carboxypeptidase [Candidatus Bathyarchaeia archaeon]